MTPENGKNDTNLQRKFKITDFLLGSGFRTWRLFCRYCYVYMSVPTFILVRETQFEVHSVESV